MRAVWSGIPLVVRGVGVEMTGLDEEASGTLLLFAFSMALGPG